jgi:hypothetical protein
MMVVFKCQRAGVFCMAPETAAKENNSFPLSLFLLKVLNILF